MFETYENRHNPHVTIHRHNCRQLREHGGIHKYKQGGYKKHAEWQQAINYANSLNLPIWVCSYCQPS